MSPINYRVCRNFESQVRVQYAGASNDTIGFLLAAEAWYGALKLGHFPEGFVAKESR